MAFLRKGFLKSTNRRNELYCRIDPTPIAAIFFAFVGMFLADIGSPHTHSGIQVDLPGANHARKLPKALREDVILISVIRDGSAYFRNTRIHPAELPGKIHEAVLNGAEKHIYLNVDARAKYGDVNAVLPYIQLSDTKEISLLAEPYYHGHF
jgi:biopolymer transport protein ExbD